MTALLKTSPLTEGNAAPSFTLPTDEGNSLSLQDLQGKKVVLYFYPKDDTPGCTKEAKDFAEHQEEFTAHNTIILGISKDDSKSHQKFKTKYCLPFTLLSDTEGSACLAYGVWVEKSMYGKKYMGIERSTFLIDETGILQKIWRKVSVTEHVSEVLNAIKRG